jgi:acetaldehyde dehydrogenase
MGAMAGIDPASDGLARARRLGVPVTAEGVDGLLAMPGFDEIGIVFDATSARAHEYNAARLQPLGKRLIDLTPAAIGPYVVPAVNLDDHLDAPNVNMVTCGGQATIPVVAAVSRVAPVPYAEIVASIASRSAGPGTRGNIDEFTETTSAAIVRVGGAGRGKAIIVLNPAEPPMVMRDTIFCAIPEDADTELVAVSIRDMVAEVAGYVPGYRLLDEPQFDPPSTVTGGMARVSVFVEVEGAGDFLPSYSGNLDIMTAAATRVGEQLAKG